MLANPDVNILSLQTSDASAGSYDARSLCKHVVFPFQKDMLGNAIDGANADPLVNKPARYPRLSKGNASRDGGTIALHALCDTLPTLTDPDCLRDTLDYMMSRLVRIAAQRRDMDAEVAEAIKHVPRSSLRTFLSDLLEKSYNGASLVLVTCALLSIQFPVDQGYKLTPHPVFQSGASSRQRSDIDIEREGKPVMGVEAKDKLFTADDVIHAAKRARDGRQPGLLFVAGRNSGVDAGATYFSEAKSQERMRGLGCHGWGHWGGSADGCCSGYACGHDGRARYHVRHV